MDGAGDGPVEADRAIGVAFSQGVGQRATIGLRQGPDKGGKGVKVMLVLLKFERLYLTRNVVSTDDADNVWRLRVPDELAHFGVGPKHVAQAWKCPADVRRHADNGRERGRVLAMGRHPHQTKVVQVLNGAFVQAKRLVQRNRVLLRKVRRRRGVLELTLAFEIAGKAVNLLHGVADVHNGLLAAVQQGQGLVVQVLHLVHNEDVVGRVVSYQRLVRLVQRASIARVRAYSGVVAPQLWQHVCVYGGLRVVLARHKGPGAPQGLVAHFSKVPPSLLAVPRVGQIGPESPNQDSGIEGLDVPTSRSRIGQRVKSTHGHVLDVFAPGTLFDVYLQCLRECHE